MLNKTSVKLGGVPKEILVMAIWGVVLLAGGLIQKNVNLGGVDGILAMWGVVTLLGIVGQGLAYVTGLGPNDIAWGVTIAIGWAFTLAAFKVSGVDFVKDMSAIWYIVLGIGYIFCAIHIDKIFYIMAGAHFLVGLMMEISLRFISSADRKGSIFDFFATNQPLFMAFFGGGSLIVASIVAYVLRTRQVTNKSMAESTPLVS